MKCQKSNGWKPVAPGSALRERPRTLQPTATTTPRLSFLRASSQSDWRCFRLHHRHAHERGGPLSCGDKSCPGAAPCWDLSYLAQWACFRSKSELARPLLQSEKCHGIRSHRSQSAVGGPCSADGLCVPRLTHSGDERLGAREDQEPGRGSVRPGRPARGRVR